MSVERSGNAGVAVIGSNSFSGASFIRYLLRHGQQVIGISRSAEPVRALLPYKWDDSGLFSFHRLDLNTNLDMMIEVLSAQRPAIIVNFASQSMVGESWAQPSDWFETNVVSTIKLHERLRRFDWLKRYVHISTPEVYGDCSGPVRENATYCPTTPYAVSRAACDMSLMTFFKAYGFPVVITRAANVYGPGQQLYRIIPKTILSILKGQKLPLHGGGTSIRSFIHIDDVADGTWKAATQGKPGEVYHLSTARQISIRDLVAEICALMQVKFEDTVDIVGERLGKDAAYVLDSSKARSDLGWTDSIDLETGLKETIDWVMDNIEELRLQPATYVHKR